MSPMSRTSVRFVTAAVLLGVTLVAGCVKRAPEPPAAPPQGETESPYPMPQSTPAPAPEPPRPPGLEGLQPAFFDFDSYGLRDDARAALDENARLLREHPEYAIVIEGHCDERGTIEYNQALGERRAQAARDYLVGAGVDASRMTTVSYGKERPFAVGSDETAWRQNRRAHLVVPAKK